MSNIKVLVGPTHSDTCSGLVAEKGTFEVKSKFHLLISCSVKRRGKHKKGCGMVMSLGLLEDRASLHYRGVYYGM